MSYRAQQGELQGGTLQPEELGIKIVFSSIIAAGVEFAGFAIVTSFLVSSTLRFNSIITTVAVSTILTFVIPALIYRGIKERLQGLAEEVQEIGNIKTRGENDRGFVIATLSLAIIGFIGWLWIPTWMNSPTRPIFAIQQNLPIFDIVEVIFLDLFIIASFGIFAGSAVATYYRAKYPRACWNCGNTRYLDSDYCSDCREPIDYIPSRWENLLNLLKNDRSYFPNEPVEEQNQGSLEG